MRSLFIFLLAITLMVSAASAAVMTSPYPLGQGGTAFSLSGVQESNFQGQSSATLMTYTFTAGYGLTESLDVYLGLGSAASSSLTSALPTPPFPAGSSANTEVKGSGYSVATKYLIFKEGGAMPVSIGVAAQYSATNVESTTDLSAFAQPANVQTQSNSQIAAGIGVAKAAFIPFIPYGALVYRKNSTGGVESSTQIDLSLGTIITLSRQIAIFLEYTSESVTPTGGSAVSLSQIGVGVGYKI